MVLTLIVSFRYLGSWLVLIMVVIVVLIVVFSFFLRIALFTATIAYSLLLTTTAVLRAATDLASFLNFLTFIH